MGVPSAPTLLQPGVIGAACLVGLTTTAILFTSHFHQEEGDSGGREEVARGQIWIAEVYRSPSKGRPLPPRPRVVARVQRVAAHHGSRRGVHRHAVVHWRELVRGAARRDSGGVVPDESTGRCVSFYFRMGNSNTSFLFGN
jgi:hypothetical protein